MSSNLSFKIAPPSRPSSSNSNPPPSRSSSSRPPARAQAWGGDDSDSDEDELSKKRKDELVTGFGSKGAETVVKEKKAAPLVIPSLANRDWRKEASAMRAGKKRKDMYLPDAVGTMRMATGAPGDEKTQGGMGTRDVINDTVVVGGIEKKEKKVVTEENGVQMEVDTVEETVDVQEVPKEKVAETEEQRALRELMAGEQVQQEQQLDAILPAAGDSRTGPLDEVDAFKRDLQTRPDESSLEDYARVPVGQFGAALLRGMGWKAGTPASRSGRAGPTEAFVPSSRPALLGIGAKPMAEVLGEEKGKNGKPVRRDRREDMKFVPLLKQERGGSASGSGRSIGIAAFEPSFVEEAFAAFETGFEERGVVIV
ncbi:G-patch domain protein [Pseudohyphozyma bogoriensis]|nr:G-patch domain protein [Pseudohyphozyma bogoriensis]